MIDIEYMYLTIQRMKGRLESLRDVPCTYTSHSECKVHITTTPTARTTYRDTKSLMTFLHQIYTVYTQYTEYGVR